MPVQRPASAKEALRLAATIRDLRERLEKATGPSGGAVEELYQSAMRLMQEFIDMSRREYRAYRRGLDALALRLSEEFKKGQVSTKHLKIFDKALQKMKIRDFYSARKVLGKLEDIIGTRSDLNSALEEYRRYYQGLENEAARLRREIESMSSVPRPPMSAGDVGKMSGALSECRESVRSAMVNFVSNNPCLGVMRTISGGGGDPELGLPRPDNREAFELLLHLLEDSDEVRKAFGNRSVHVLAEVLEYSDARLAHQIVDPRALKRVLQENISWLKALTSPSCFSPAIALDRRPESILAQASSWLAFLERIPGSEEARARLRQAGEMVSSGMFLRAVESDAIYRKYGELARMAFSGAMGSAVDEMKERLDGILEDVDGLPQPSKV